MSKKLKEFKCFSHKPLNLISLKHKGISKRMYNLDIRTLRILFIMAVAVGLYKLQ